ncbi:hypothetical protein BACI71_40353 [Bacillus mycoides]|uniref:Uncharacterized protein n=2 Tax=Bacillus TaxID=1386 RepID=A0A653ZWW3_BACMY|nr:hypothetical protein BACI71_40353 [Bacillus mycoides]
MHIGNHSVEYIEEVYNVLRMVKKQGGTQEDVVDALHDIRERLLDGGLQLNKPKK